MFPSLPLSNIIPVTVTVSPIAPAGPAFNMALILGPSAVIASVGNGTIRTQLFTSLTQMITAGFTSSQPEYLAAEVYFAQGPTYLWVGRQDLTAIAAVVLGASGGTGYAVGNVLTVVQTGGSFGQVQVLTIGGGGAVTSVQLLQGLQGTGYAVAANLATTGGTGTGCEISITAIGETPVQSITACRIQNPQWYICMYVGATSSPVLTGIIDVPGTGYALNDIVTVTQSNAGGSTFQVTAETGGVPSALTLLTPGKGYTTANGLATTGGAGTGLTISISAGNIDADIQTVAEFIEACTPASQYFYTTAEAAVLNNTTPNIMATLQDLGLRRTQGVYSTTQGGSYPLNVYASAAPMGYAMASNTGAPGSFFALNNATLEDVAPEPLSQTQANAIMGTVQRTTPGLNGNLYLAYANRSYLNYQPGIQAGGTWFDEVLNLDQLASNLQIAAMNLFKQVKAVPITNGGVNMMLTALLPVLVQAQAVGWISPSGQWNGVTIGTGNNQITDGTPFPQGYLWYVPPISSLTSAQRENRQLPPFTLALIYAQSANSLAINVIVQQ